ncbi:MAG TPA: metallophosphoesterase [Gaiellaceae bacterium]|nr:metallophosphoesterase [Gaiellaceae bacterium]
MPARVLHVSDLHFGTHEDRAVERALAALLEQARPELVVASGDLTNRGRASEHERAARFLQGLGPPVLAVPGNHDIPYTFPARFAHPWREFERRWQTVEPVYASPTLHAVGLNSVRPWRHQSGGLRDAQLERAAERLAEAAPGAYRIVALHHQLVGAPWRTRKKPVARRNEVLARLVDSGAELILGGHIHQAAVSSRDEFEVTRGDESRAVVVSIAPGLGQPRPSRRGEARGLHVYAVEADAVEVETSIWRRDGWALTARRRFPRGAGPLAVSAAAAPAPPASAA